MSDAPGSPTFTDLEETKPETQTSPVQAAVDRARAAERDARPAAGGGKRGRGRPKGSKTRRPAPASSPESEPQDDDEKPPTPAELRGVGAMWGVVWMVASRSGRVRRLEKSEELELAEASIPVLKKYAPIFERYAVEINLGFVFTGMVMQTLVQPPPPVQVSAPAPAAPPSESTQEQRFG